MGKAYLIFITISVIVCVILLIRNEVTYNNHMKLADAIFKYNIHSIIHDTGDAPIGYNCIESYGLSLFRIWDFGYKNMVSKEVLEKIEPFMEKG